MKKNYASSIVTLFVAGMIALIYFLMMPQWVSKEAQPLSEFSTQRALAKVAALSKKPHYIGSENHTAVAATLEKELQQLGLETTIQEGTTLSDWGNLTKSKNILARIRGTDHSKALLLLSHYDSAPHSSSLGASDDASGIATILESVRAFLHNKTPHKNDIIILFSDAEELGLNGAALFVTKSDWAKEVGLVLNFEARGTAGPSYMLMEVNKGNAAMVNAFSKANPKYPVSNSLMYSIYKMLPNDTDLTVFREQQKIQGFNFAFIDDHFNYHTLQDDINHLSPKTLAHQGTYLVPLLDYFANADLTQMNATEDEVYFNTPFYFVSYPFSWVLAMWIGAVLLLLGLVFIGIGKRILLLPEIGKGFLLLLGALSVSGLVAFLGWKLLLVIYPQYSDILQGFTYNGHDYIAAFVFLSLAIGFLFYRKTISENLVLNYFIAPLLLWIILNLGLALYLPGAGFFIIPVYFGLMMLGYFVITQRVSHTLNLVLSIPALIIFVPFITMFPIGLGLKVLVGSAVLTLLVFGLLLPILGIFTRKEVWALALFLIAIGFLVKAHWHSGYEKGKAKPNSLLYVYDADKASASWATYDAHLDSWTKNYLGAHPTNAATLNRNPLFSKYHSELTFMADAPKIALARPTVTLLQDTLIGNQRQLKIKISPNRKVNRYDIFANEKMIFYHFTANGASPLGQIGSKYERKGKKLISYYVVDNDPLELHFSIPKNTPLDMTLMESSFDLLTNPKLNITKRTSWMMPMPFVLNDAVVILQKLKPMPAIKKPVFIKWKEKAPSVPLPIINDTIPAANEIH